MTGAKEEAREEARDGVATEAREEVMGARRSPGTLAEVAVGRKDRDERIGSTGEAASGTMNGTTVRVARTAKAVERRPGAAAGKREARSLVPRKAKRRGRNC